MNVRHRLHTMSDQTVPMWTLGDRLAKARDGAGISVQRMADLLGVDVARIGQTRALDGMVESANGRSTWTYHPDDGLTIVCA